ncbi:MAG: sugar ABC transporter permease [bacterium]|nr:sugar ABC transporter permease [bacterium]
MPSRGRALDAGDFTRPPTRQPGLIGFVIFFGPLIAFYAVFYFFSFAFLIRTSFQDVSLSLRNAAYVGWENYRLLLDDPRFIEALKNNFVFAGVSIVAAATIGFFIAVALWAGARGKGMFYAAFLLPSLMPIALVAAVFRTMLESRFGAINEFLREVGLGALAQRWLIDPDLAYGVVIIMFVYLIGLPILYYTANLALINTSLLESAVLDGARPLRLMYEILFPIMKSTHKTVTLSTVLISFRAFDIVFFSTGGGPAGRTEITGTYVYNFTTSGTNVGFASAAAVTVLIISLVVSAVQLRIYRQKGGPR